MSARRMRALVMGVRPGGALHRALDPDGWNWSNSDELLATIAELVDKGNRLRVAVTPGAKSGDIPKAIVIPRPWKAQAQRGTTMAEFAAMVSRDKKEWASER